MTKTTKILLSGLLISVLLQEVKAQSTSLGHFGFSTATDWCGWNNNIIPFNLEHRGTNNINFLTGSLQRATIRGTNAGLNAGFMGIGLNFTTPISLLHLNGSNNNTGNLFRTDGNTAQLNQWQLFTNGAAGNTEKFRVEVLSGSSSAGLQANQGNMYFGTTNTMHINEGCEGLILPVNIDSCCNALDNSSFC